MKRIFLFLPIYFITCALSAKQLVNGYVILPNNDTVKCKIVIQSPPLLRKSPIESLYLYDKIAIRDSLGNELTYPAKGREINGFGLVYHDKRYDYVLQETRIGHPEFIMRVFIGIKLNLYSRYEYYGTKSAYEIYTLEDSTKRKVRIDSRPLDGYKKKVRLFLKDNPTLLSLFNNKVSGWKDIKEFVQEANAY